MNKKTIKILCWIAILLFVFLYYFNGDILQSAGSSVFITSGIWVIWDNFLWQYFANKYGMPKNINGQWVGSLRSSYIKNLDEKKVDIKIRQKFSNVQIEIKTNEILSHSICSQWLDEKSLYPRLFYSYQTKPIALYKPENLPQFGSGILCIESSTKIYIEYWTSQQTKGVITAVKINSKV